MNTSPFIVEAVIDLTANARALVDSGCLTYGVISEDFVRRHDLETMKISPKPIRGVTGATASITKVARARMDIDSHTEEGAFFYVVPDHLGYDLILGLPWLRRHDACLEPKRGRMFLRATGARLLNRDKRPLQTLDVAQVTVSAMSSFLKRNTVGTFAVSLADIQKALTPKKPTDPRTKLPQQYHEFLGLFSAGNANKLPPHRGEGVDHKIELIQQDGKDPEVPWGPLYNMSREELIVLRKTLVDLLDKGFIRVSHSSAAAPVLFVRKPNGGLRFCVDYRALNAITKKDRYPLPLIHETLERVGKAKWFTKLDVSAAFHKVRIQKGQEWMTAFRTRYGLYEWLVTPFGLANAPSTFQKYINWTLRKYLDQFCSAYIDDILIFTDGSLDDHRAKVKLVLTKLQEAGLYLDIDKCEFERTETKYLGFIVRAGVGIQMDPEKVRTIKEWKSPTTVKGVRGFLGFANFYRRFISNFSKMARPLTDLTHKDKPFLWTDECEQAFKQLKEMFLHGPTLASFDPDRKTVVECDSSGYNVGGVLSQVDDKGILRPCAFFSRKNSPAESNYEIYDKELLAVVRCLEEWDSELRSVKSFEVVTDHKNLEYFFRPRKLTERHVRWSLFLSRFNFTFRYRQGKENGAADALSRRDQDMPKGYDPRVESRTIQLLNQPVVAAPLQPTGTATSTHDNDELWTQAIQHDETYQDARRCVREGLRQFPSRLGLKVSMSECRVIDDRLQFRERLWVPEFEPLRTALIQKAHDSPLTGHPGRELTYGILYPEYFWPGMSTDIRRFVRNCDVCNRSKASREQRKGLLKPLPLPDRPWQEVSMDFVTDLPESSGCKTILVITDRLTKGVILEGVTDLSANATAWTIVRTLIRQHGFPQAITSDRGTQFVNETWACVCRLAGIQRRLSTAYHPQTDGATERMNSVMETYLRAYVCYDQKDWAKLLPMAELAMNGRVATATGVSPFFLSHGFDLSPFEPRETQDEGAREPRSPIQKGEAIVRTIKNALDWAQSSMAFAQQEAERFANRQRSPAPEYQVGDKVWLNLRNIRTTRPCKKLDWKNAKYEVTETIGTHAVRLNTPGGIHDVFHVDLIRPAASDPFPSQQTDDQQPPPIQVDGEDEWIIRDIVDETRSRRGRGWQVKYTVAWEGYARTTMESRATLEDTAALERWLDKTRPFRNANGTLNKQAMAAAQRPQSTSAS